jgi:hypothetical protein
VYTLSVTHLLVRVNVCVGGLGGEEDCGLHISQPLRIFNGLLRLGLFPNALRLICTYWVINENQVRLTK